MSPEGRPDPVALWRACALAEEMPLDGEAVFAPLLDADACARHRAQISARLRRLPQAVGAPYGAWAAREDSYRFASEAFYQHRLLAWLDNACRAQRVSAGAPIFLARQVIRPSAFADTPRIKQLAGVAFVIYPQAAIYWLYEMMALLALEIDGAPSRNDTLAEFLRRIIARISFAKAARPEAAYGIDFLLDEIVLQGAEMAPAHPVAARAVRLAQGVEDLIVNHELAHAFLEHGAGGRPADAQLEGEADRLALSLMLFSMTGDWGAQTEREFEVSTWPFEAYVALQVWGLIREAADRRARALVGDDPAALLRERARSEQARRIRLQRLQALDGLFRFEAPPAVKEILQAGNRLIDRIMSLSLDEAEVARIVRLSRALAREDYSQLRRDIVGDVR